MMADIKHLQINIIIYAIFLLGLSTLCWAEEQTPQGLTVEVAVRIALENSLQRRMAQGDIVIAQDKTDQAVSAYGPTLTLDGGFYHYNEAPGMVQLQQDLVKLNNALSAMTYGAIPEKEPLSDSLNYYGIKLQLTQPLYTGGKLTATKMQAQANEKNAKANLGVSENDLARDVKKAYYTVLLCRQLSVTMDEAVASMADHVREATEYYRLNTVSRIDVLRAEERLAELRQQQLLALNNFALARSSLNYVLGVDLNTDYSFEDQIVAGELSQGLDSCQAEALSRRPELEAMDARIEMARQGVAVAKSGNMPTVALVANRYQYEPENEIPSASVGVVATLKLYDHGMISHQVAEAEDVLKKAETGKEQVQRGIMLEVEQAYRNAEASVRSIDAAEKNLATSKETLRAAQTRYKVGLSTSLERLDAEVGLTKAKASCTQALSMYNIAMAELDRAMGKGADNMISSDPVR